jgi:hypothetical protein
VDHSYLHVILETFAKLASRSDVRAAVSSAVSATMATTIQPVATELLCAWSAWIFRHDS